MTLSGCAWDTDKSLCKSRVSLEVHLITLILDSKSSVPCERKMFYHKSADQKRSQSLSVISLLKYSGLLFV